MPVSAMIMMHVIFLIIFMVKYRLRLKVKVKDWISVD